MQDAALFDANNNTFTRSLWLTQAADGNDPPVCEQLHDLYYSAPKGVAAQLSSVVAALSEMCTLGDVKQLVLDGLGGCVTGFLGFRTGRGR